jgi:Outer membrane lipoprotein-sorting protein
VYDKDGKLVRELHASGHKKASGSWGARHVEMRSVEEKLAQCSPSTIVKFNQHLDEKLFTPESLESAPAIKH